MSSTLKIRPRRLALSPNSSKNFHDRYLKIHLKSEQNYLFTNVWTIIIRNIKFKNEIVDFCVLCFFTFEPWKITEKVYLNSHFHHSTSCYCIFHRNDPFYSNFYRKAPCHPIFTEMSPFYSICCKLHFTEGYFGEKC